MVKVGTMSKKLFTFACADALVDALSLKIASILKNALETNNRASLLVSGGNTPKKLFEALSNIKLPWEKICVGLVDERCIDVTQKESNEFLVRTTLLQNYAQKAPFIGMYSKDIDVDALSQLYQKELYPYDVVLLGMGTDGHTASLFPHNERLKEAFDAHAKEEIILIEPQSAPYTRMSMNLKAILSAQHLFLHFEGKEKYVVYEKALKENNPFVTPISAVLHSKKNVEVYYA